VDQHYGKYFNSEGCTVWCAPSFLQGRADSHVLFYTGSVKFYYVYILQSKTTPSWIYVGYTENLKKRFSEHNQGDTPSTKKYRPFRLIHYEAYANKKDAKRRELYLKTTKGKTTVKTMLIEYFRS
jgi:putative endonuclease